MGRIDIREDIPVGVVMTGDTITPRWFVWDGCKLDVSVIIRRWTGYHAGACLRYFAVTTHTGEAFVLCYNPRENAWMAKVGE